MSYRYKPNAKFESASRKVARRITSRDAILGDENNQVDCDEIGYHWARLAASADVNSNATFGPSFQVRAGLSAIYTPASGRRVRIKLSDEDGEWEVSKGNFKDLIQGGYDPRALNPNSPERAFHYLDQIVDTSSRGIGSGLKVQMQGWKYNTADYTFKIDIGTDATTQIDLTSFRPVVADTHRYVVVAFNVSEDLLGNAPWEVYGGTSISLFTRLTEADIQTAYDLFPSNERIVPVMAYYLEYGQSEIKGPSLDVDLRTAWNLFGVIDREVTLGKLSDGTPGKVIGYDGSGHPAELTLPSAGAPSTATYILQTADAGLPNAQAMGALGSGIVKNTTTTGVQSIAAAGTDYTSPTGTENLSNKTITASSLIATALSLLIGGFKAIFSHANSADRTYTLPNYDGTLATLAGTETLSAKTLTSPAIADFSNAQHDHGDADDGGNITGAAFGTQTANTGLYGPTTGAAAAPTFRAMVTADITNDIITQAKMANDSVGTNELIDANVTNAKLATNAVTQVKIADFSVGTNELIDLSVNSTKIADSTIGIVKLDFGTPDTLIGYNPSGAPTEIPIEGLLYRDWQAFSTAGSDTWTKPAGAKWVRVIVVAAGSGGGSGTRRATSNTRSGGGGGAAGGVTDMWYDISELPNATYDLVVGTGGTGGTAITVDATLGNPGNQGGNSWFGHASEASALQIAVASSNALGGGRGGGGGTSAGGVGNTVPSANLQVYGANGGAGGLDAAATTEGAPSALGPGSGGGGGGITAANVVIPGVAGGLGTGPRFRAVTGGGGTAGSAAAGGNGGNGLIDGTGRLTFGSGGGSGGPSAGAGRAGGNGGTPGGGGGGGSGSSNGNNSGAGGNGANGAVIVVTYCFYPPP